MVLDKLPDQISEALVPLEAGVMLDNGVDCYEELEYEEDASRLIATNEDFSSTLGTTAIHWDKEDGGRTTGETKNSFNKEIENGACNFESHLKSNEQLQNSAEKSSEELFPSKLEAVEDAYQVFDEMLKPAQTGLLTAEESFSTSLLENEVISSSCDEG